MKKTLTIFLFVFVLTIQAQLSSSQYFDGGASTNSIMVSVAANTNNIWQIGKPQKTLFYSAATLPNAIVTDTLNFYPKNNNSKFVLTIKNPYMNSPFPFALQWKQKLNMDSKKDGGIVEFSNNGGGTWQNTHNNVNVYQYYGFQPANKDTININEYCFSGTDTTWRDIWLCLAPAIANFNDTILFRYTFKSDSVNTNKEGWMIDNFMAHTTIFHPVKEISQIDEVVVYPTITNGIVNVEVKKTSPTDIIDKIELLNVDGKIMEWYGQNYTKVVLDLSKHIPGIYYVKISINKKSMTRKIIYEKN